MSRRALYLAFATLALGVGVLVLLLEGRGGSRTGERGPGAAAGPSEVLAAAPPPAVELSRTAPPEATGRLQTEPALNVEPAPAAAPELAAEGFDAEGVYGVVVDEDARGVPGARVVLFDGSRRLSEQGESLAETSCDDEGSFRFRDLDICRSYMVYVTAADYLPGFEWLTSGHHEKIELRRAQVIRGRILEKKTREPIADALVYVDRWHYVFEEDDAPPTFEVQLKSLSGEDGSYELHGVRLEGNQEVKVQAKPPSAPEKTRFQIDPERSDGYDILIGETKTLSIELYDIVKREPVTTEVSINGNEFEGRPDGRHAYRHSAGKRDRYLSIRSPGWCRTIVHPLSSGDELRIPMSRGATVTGRVVNHEGLPVAGARVLAGGGPRNVRPPGVEKDFMLRSEDTRFYSGPDGRFTITGIAPTGELRHVRATHEDHVESAREELVLAAHGETAEVELELVRPSRIRGIVRVDGEPISARVCWSAGDARGSARSNDRGAYLLRAVPPGEITLRVELDGTRNRWRNDRDEDDPGEVVVVGENETLEHDLEITSERVPISGSVVDERGEPLGGVTVWAWAERNEEGFSGRGTTEADGSFSMSVQAESGLFYRVSAHEGHRTARRENVSPGTEDLELVLPDLGLLRLKVVDAFTRETLQGARLYYRVHPDEPLQLLYQGGSRFQPGPDGYFTAKLPQGRFEVVVTAGDKGYVPARLEHVRITMEEPAEASVSLEPGVRTTFTFEAEPGLLQALQEAFRENHLFAVRADQRAERERGGPYFGREVRGYQHIARKSERRGVIQGLAPGTYQILGIPGHLRFRPSTFEIKPRDRAEVTIRVERRPGKGNPGGQGG